MGKLFGPSKDEQRADLDRQIAYAEGRGFEARDGIVFGLTPFKGACKICYALVQRPDWDSHLLWHSNLKGTTE